MRFAFKRSKFFRCLPDSMYPSGCVLFAAFKTFSCFRFCLTFQRCDVMYDIQWINTCILVRTRFIYTTLGLVNMMHLKSQTITSGWKTRDWGIETWIKRFRGWRNVEKSIAHQFPIQSTNSKTPTIRRAYYHTLYSMSSPTCFCRLIESVRRYLVVWHSWFQLIPT